MRMWMIDSRMLCNRHLCGEHGEIHKHRHNFVKGHSIEGRRGQIEPESMSQRHDDLAREMLSRGMKHESPYVQPDLSKYDLSGFTVDRNDSMLDLKARCCECEKRMEKEIAA